MHLEVLSIVENEDGSANVVFEMDQKTFQKMAEVGVLKVLTDAATKFDDPNKDPAYPYWKQGPVVTRQEKLDKELDEQRLEWISDDLPDLLRKAARTIKDPTDTLWWKAAQEIEKLRKERDELYENNGWAASKVAELEQEIEKLQKYKDRWKRSHRTAENFLAQKDALTEKLQTQAEEIERLKKEKSLWGALEVSEAEIAALTERVERYRNALEAISIQLKIETAHAIAKATLKDEDK